MTVMDGGISIKVFTQVVSVAALVSAGFVFPAQAASAADDPEISISYGDLNLDSQRGREELRARVRAAADSLCDELDAGASPVTMTRAECFTVVNRVVRAELRRDQVSEAAIAAVTGPARA